MTDHHASEGGFAGHIAGYADSIARNFQLNVDAQPEDQLKAPVGELLRAIGGIAGKAVDYRTEVRVDDVTGTPDLGITIDQQLIGLVELKAPGVGARPEQFKGRNADQWKRFSQFPNLIYTDGEEWSLYQNGERKSRARISTDITHGGRRAVVSSERSALETLLHSFLAWGPTAPQTAEALAAYLAPLARILRDRVRESLTRRGSPLQALAKEWSGLLFPEGEDAQFADAYAQTLTYALLLARFEGAEQLGRAFAIEALHREHGLLAEAVDLLEVGSVREELRVPIGLLERAISAVDSVRLNRQGDPWIYFYEHFLASYDPQLRKDRGVYYTPVEVVGAQTRLAAELLRTRFGKPLAFADAGVSVLDPATGTGTYLLSVLDHAKEAVRRQYGEGAVGHRISGLAGRLYGFELLVGAYSVAHLRLTQRLQEAGVTDEPPRVYLTDTLESPHRLPEFQGRILQEQLTRERARAQEVKASTRVLVCIGNPPYDRETRDPAADDGSRRKGGWVRYGSGEPGDVPILEDFIAPARAAGQGVNLKSLYNDYVYFWRWALWKVFDSTADAGIVTFITASSYLRGPGFAGMRRKMREVFDELWIIDLEGDSLGARKTENVFAIRTPVAIAIGVRDGAPKPDLPARAWKVRLTGASEEKLARLDEVDGFDDLPWQECSAEWSDPFYARKPGEYADWPPVTDLFPWQHSGALLKRTWPIGVTPKVLERRWHALLAQPPEVRVSWFRETRDRKARGEYPPLPGQIGAQPIFNLDADTPTPDISKYAYRSFDRSYVLRDARLGDFNRPVLHRAHSEKQVYLTSLLTQVAGSGPAAVAAASIPDLHHFCGRGGKDIIPLWRDADATEPNVAGGLLPLLGQTYGAPVSPERLFAYAYGVLAQPAYVERFWDELELPPPRLPLTKDAALFERAAALGSRLLSLHTYGERYGDVPHGAARCTKGVPPDPLPADHSYDSKTQVLRVGDGTFAPVSPEVYGYSVSGMPIVKSWLDRRKREPSGRKSSPLDGIGPERWEFTEELLELLWVLEETVRLQPEGAALLDEVCAGPLFTAAELPAPDESERRPPAAPGHEEQASFDV